MVEIKSEEKVKEMVNKIHEAFQGDFGRQQSYGEGTSDIYNPLEAGMKIQRIKDLFYELTEAIGLIKDFSNGHYKPYRFKEGEE